MKRNIDIYKITSTAFLMALAIILSRVPFLSTYISIGGVNLVKIGFQEIPLMIVCLFNGPIYSMIASFGSDLIAALVLPTGPYFPGFTFDALLLGIFPALFLKFYKNSQKKFLILYSIAIFLVSTIFMSQIGSLGEIKIGQYKLALPLWLKILFIAGVPFLSLINLVVLVIAERKNKRSYFKLYEIYSVFYIRDILIAPIIAPIWFIFLYNIPYSLSYVSQLLSKFITLPILSAITMLLVLPLSKVSKNILEDTYPVEDAVYSKLINGIKL